jgi:hypothetical protein
VVAGLYTGFADDMSTEATFGIKLPTRQLHRP